MSKKILKAARRQQAELDDAEGGPSPAKHVNLPATLKGQLGSRQFETIWGHQSFDKELKKINYLLPTILEKITLDYYW